MSLFFCSVSFGLFLLPSGCFFLWVIDVEAHASKNMYRLVYFCLFSGHPWFQGLACSSRESTTNTNHAVHDDLHKMARLFFFLLCFVIFSLFQLYSACSIGFVFFSIFSPCSLFSVFRLLSFLFSTLFRFCFDFRSIFFLLSFLFFPDYFMSRFPHRIFPIFFCEPLWAHQLLELACYRRAFTTAQHSTAHHSTAQSAMHEAA